MYIGFSYNVGEVVVHKLSGRIGEVKERIIEYNETMNNQVMRISYRVGYLDSGYTSKVFETSLEPFYKEDHTEDVNELFKNSYVDYLLDFDRIEELEGYINIYGGLKNENNKWDK